MISDVKKLRHIYTYKLIGRNIDKETGLALEEAKALSSIPGFLLILLLLHEDDLFFIHNGFNFREIKNRVFAWFSGDAALAGGSSITQQLAKNLFLTPHRSWVRKLTEPLYVFAFERLYSKQEILALYLHNIKFARTTSISGITDAANFYFKKQVNSLTFVESLFLLGIIPNPSYFHNEIILNGQTLHFRFKNAHGRLIDYFRIIYRSFGPLALNLPETISFEDAVSVMKNYHQFRHDEFSSDEQAAFEVRAALVLDDLLKFIETLRL